MALGDCFEKRLAVIDGKGSRQLKNAVERKRVPSRLPFSKRKPLAVFSLFQMLSFKQPKGQGPVGSIAKTESAVRAIHRPTNTVVLCQNGRCQHSNKAEAIKLLKARVDSLASSSAQRQKRAERLEQIGSGQRGDKVRTVQVQNGRVVNHLLSLIHI